MNKRDSFTHSDLAYEKRTVLPNSDKKWQSEHGIEYHESEENGIKYASLEVKTEEGAALIGKPIGKYITLFFGKLRTMEDDTLDVTRSVISRKIRDLAEEMLGRRLTHRDGVLVVGLGNREITSDAIGPKTADKLTVTRHIKYADEDVWNELDMCEVSALSPGVLGQTGIETVELVRGAAKNVAPSLLIVVDALAARSCERLASTVQLSDVGIEPGSGIGNRRKAIDRDTVGVPVMSIGVPTVVDSSTLVYDALSKAGIKDIDRNLREVLENGRGFFVSPKDSDLICHEVSSLLSEAIDLAMTL